MRLYNKLPAPLQAELRGHVNVFLAEKRGFYDLELLWGDAPRVDWSPQAAAGEPCC